MSKIRMNTEYRKKLYNRIKDVFEKEDTQERQGFLEARENFENQQTTAFELARQVVERSYPTEDVATLRKFKKKYGDPCDVVAKDKCFYFAHNEDVDDEGEEKQTKSHFDLVCMAISMVMSMVVMKITTTLLTHIIERNLKPMVAIQILLLNNLVRITTHIRPNT